VVVKVVPVLRAIANALQVTADCRRRTDLEIGVEPAAGQKSRLGLAKRAIAYDKDRTILSGVNYRC
jgi:hypothetical protein